MPNVTALISDYRIIDPTQFESQFGLVEANITHGDTLPFHMFWMRPMPGLHAYGTPTRGLYLSGNGTWPGNYISGFPGTTPRKRCCATCERRNWAKGKREGGGDGERRRRRHSREVSPATVSRVLAGRVPVATETRARVLKAIEELGYRPTRWRAASGRPRPLGGAGDRRHRAGHLCHARQARAGRARGAGARPGAVQSRPSPGSSAPFRGAGAPSLGLQASYCHRRMTWTWRSWRRS